MQTNLSMQAQLGNAFCTLMQEAPYDKINVNMLCSRVPTSRRTFYNYFHDKKELVEWVVARDFCEHALPLLQNGMGAGPLCSAFQYIQDNAGLYQGLFAVDEGCFLSQCLIKAYDAMLAGTPASPAAQNRPPQDAPVDLQVYRMYAHAGLASVVVNWLAEGMRLPVERIARDVALMMENPLTIVRQSLPLAEPG